MDRYRYDLSHHSFMAGRMGRLMTLSNIPIVAGDSFELSCQSVFRLSPLRRNLTLDAMVDVFAFYVPYRHLWPNFTDFIKEGIDENQTFATGPTLGAGDSHPHYLAQPKNIYAGRTIPLPNIAGYNRIWNRYFRDPTDEISIRSDVQLETSQNGHKYGTFCCKPKNIWTTGINPAGMPDASDREVDVVSSKMDILDLAKIKARYKTEIEREYFGQRYNDILEGIYGSGVNIDADERPELCMRSTQWLSGYDVDGTDDATLGSFAGKAASMINLHMPRKFFPEHGNLWIMALVRFPIVHESECHYFAKRTNPTYQELAGDPDIIKTQEPLPLEIQDIFGATTSNTEIGLIPYGQWYRTHPSISHANYDELNGFPFIRDLPTSRETAVYYNDGDYDDTFQTTQLGHWQSQSLIAIEALRVIPGAKSSIFAGAN